MTWHIWLQRLQAVLGASRVSTRRRACAGVARCGAIARGNFESLQAFKFCGVADFQRAADFQEIRSRRASTDGWALAQVEQLESRQLLTVNFVFDYTLDTSGFFNTFERQQTLQQAGRLVSDFLSDSLTAITPGAGNSWTALFADPRTGSVTSRNNLSIGGDSIVVFVGARDLPGGTFAEGAPGGYTGNGTQAWLDTLAARGQAGALPPVGQSATDFGPWGGSLSFDAVGTDWYFGASDFGLGSSQIDFMSVAMHELGHVLGFGTSESFDRFIASGKFTGPQATAAYDGTGNPPLSGDRGHWAEGVTDSGHEAAMEPTLAPGTRKLFTGLDFAALNDLGWNSNTLPANATVLISPSTTLTTSENGGIASFQVVLGSRPNSDVTFNLSSSNINEGMLSTSTLIFTPASWNIPQNVIVTGIDDLAADGNQSYQIVTSAVVSSDPRFNGINPIDLTVTNLDDEVSGGITVTPTTGLVTTEQGGTDSFQVFLSRAPTSMVSIRVTSSDLREGTTSTTNLIFTPTNWNLAQTVIVRGVDDHVSDSNKLYTIVLAAAISLDPAYSGIDPTDVSVINASIPDRTPTITLPGTIATLQQNGLPVAVDSSATVQDPDSPFISLNGAKLFVNISQNSTTADRLQIRNAGKGKGMVSVSSDGTSVSFEGKKIGSISSTSSGVTITFNSAAKMLGVQAVVRHFEMRVTTSNRSNLDRIVSFRLTLPDGTSSNVATKAVRVNTGILPPILNVGPSPLEYTNRAVPQLITPTASLIDPDSMNFSGGKLTIAFLSGSNSGDVLQIRRQGRGAGQIDAAQDGKIRFGTTVIGNWSGGKAGKPLVITLKSTASLASVQALIRNIMFSTASTNSSLSDRVLEFQVSDGDGGVSTPVTKTIHVN